MNYHQYEAALISLTGGRIPRKILRHYRRVWRSFLRISSAERDLPRDPLDIVFGVIR